MHRNTQRDMSTVDRFPASGLKTSECPFPVHRRHQDNVVPKLKRGFTRIVKVLSAGWAIQSTPVDRFRQLKNSVAHGRGTLVHWPWCLPGNSSPWWNRTLSWELPACLPSLYHRRESLTIFSLKIPYCFFPGYRQVFQCFLGSKVTL
jgi:hypothetical protein